MVELEWFSSILTKEIASPVFTMAASGERGQIMIGKRPLRGGLDKRQSRRDQPFYDFAARGCVSRQLGGILRGLKTDGSRDG
jgi:hypothetical protein